MRGILSACMLAAALLAGFTGASVAAAAEAGLVQPPDFSYLGAFRLPDDGDRPRTFAYGGNAMTFNPAGDATGEGDGFPGSLLVMGHDRMPYEELPDGNQVAEVSIPKPSVTKDPSQLPQASFVRPFHDIARGMFSEYDELPRVGMACVDHADTGSKLHIAWGQHFHEDEQDQAPTHAWLDVDGANARGPWYVGNESLYSVNGYLFEIPAAWAEAHVGGRCLATGRYRDGGWSGQGPALVAYRPWMDAKGTAAQAGTRLEPVVLLKYADSRTTEDTVAQSLRGYQHADEWEGGAWLTTASGKGAVLFAGTKGVGAKYWYGWINPAGPEQPCVETELVDQFTTCRNADGSPCPKSDLGGCEGHSDYRGWWSSAFEAQFILYDPDDFARVAAGEMVPSAPQPYASLALDSHLLLNPSHVEEDMLGTGSQRRYRIGDVAYDRANDLLYVLELFADEAKPVVHVWRVK